MWIHVQGTDSGRLQPITCESKSVLGRHSQGQSESWRTPGLAWRCFLAQQGDAQGKRLRRNSTCCNARTEPGCQTPALTIRGATGRSKVPIPNGLKPTESAPAPAVPSIYLLSSPNPPAEAPHVTTSRNEPKCHPARGRRPGCPGEERWEKVCSEQVMGEAPAAPLTFSSSAL